MIEYVRSVLASQFEASLCMFNEGIKLCPPEHWQGKVTRDTFQQIAYHTLFFVDLYLSRSEESFTLRELNKRGGDEREPVATVGLSKEDTLAYVAICRQKMLDVIAAETEASIHGSSGFSYRKVTRGELHFYNIRHIQHHTGQMSAYLRRAADVAVPWTGSGWRE